MISIDELITDYLAEGMTKKEALAKVRKLLKSKNKKKKRVKSDNYWCSIDKTNGRHRYN